VVVIFPDNIFKYTSSLRRHLPDLFPPDDAAPGPRAADPLLGRLRDNLRASDDVIDMGELSDMMDQGNLLLVDIRPPHEYAEEHASGSINIPLEALQRDSSRLPKDLASPIVTLCNAGKVSIDAVSC
jgi:hypothetical protein